MNLFEEELSWILFQTPCKVYSNVYRYSWYADVVLLQEDLEGTTHQYKLRLTNTQRLPNDIAILLHHVMCLVENAAAL